MYHPLLILALVALATCDVADSTGPALPVSGELDIQVWQFGMEAGSPITPVHIGIGQDRQITADTVISHHFAVARFRDLPFGDAVNVYMFRRTDDGIEWLNEISDIQLSRRVSYRFYTMFVP